MADGRDDKELKIPRKPDRVVLSALLYSGKLTPTEEKAFRSMLEMLDSGQVKLTPSQRMWADQIYDKLRLGVKPDPKSVVKSKTAKAAERLSEHPFDSIIRSRPLKPPGRS